MIDYELRRDLGVQGERRQLNVQWFGGRATRQPTNVVSLEISGLGKQVRHALRSVYSVLDLSLPKQTLNRRDVQCVHKDARLPMKAYSNMLPKLLIGLDHGHLGFPRITCLKETLDNWTLTKSRQKATGYGTCLISESKTRISQA